MPEIVKHFICLANSRKLHGRCAAGIELGHGTRGSWIRPVSSREHQEVSEIERQYMDGSDPQLLDTLAVAFLRHEPRDFQTENWLIDPERYWLKTGRLSKEALAEFTVSEPTLWINGHHSHSGLNDKVPLAEAVALRTSLRLVAVRALRLVVGSPGAAFGNPKRRVQGRFALADLPYACRVTDPTYERDYLAQPDGEYSVGPCYLTVSLGEPLEGNCFKLIAAIIPQGAGVHP